MKNKINLHIFYCVLKNREYDYSCTKCFFKYKIGSYESLVNAFPHPKDNSFIRYEMKCSHCGNIDTWRTSYEDSGYIRYLDNFKDRLISDWFSLFM